MYSYDVIFENGELLACVLDEGEPIIKIVPGLIANKKFEAEETLQTLVENENDTADFVLESVKDQIVSIDAVDTQYQIDETIDILDKIQNIIKSKEAKRLLKRVFDKLEQIHRRLDSFDTSIELACEEINEFLEKRN